jgi:uncharacterized protein (TIGR03435 family)
MNSNATPIAIVSAFSLFTFIGGAQGQSTGTVKPHFEVAAVKPSNPTPGPNDRRAFSSNGRFEASGLSLVALVSYAYGVENYQISQTGPGWIYSDRYDIVAKEGGNVSNDQVLLMVQSLLEDRFKLMLHRETKELPVFALIVGKNGLKLKKSADDARYSIRVSGDQWTVTHLDMPGLATRLSREVGRTVVDMTGVTGPFDFTLEWAHEHPPDANGADSGAPSLFTAVEEQLGLKLEPRKQATELLTIERVERPSEN